MSEKVKLQVAGVTINRDDSRVVGVKTIEDIKALFIFSHLDKDARAKAEIELFEKLTGGKEEQPAVDEEKEKKAQRLKFLKEKSPDDLTSEDLADSMLSKMSLNKALQLQSPALIMRRGFELKTSLYAFK